MGILDAEIEFCIRENYSPVSMESFSFVLGQVIAGNDSQGLAQAEGFLKTLIKNKVGGDICHLLTVVIMGAKDNILRAKLREEHRNLPERSKKILLLLHTGSKTLDRLRVELGCGYIEAEDVLQMLREQKFVDLYSWSGKGVQVYALSPRGRIVVDNLTE